MSNVLSELTFQTYLFLFQSDIINTYFKTHILEDNTFYDKVFTVFVNGDGHSFLFLTGCAFGSFIDEVCDFFQFTDSKYLLSRLKIRVRNKVAVLCKQVIY